jgi:hypothetical protein
MTEGVPSCTPKCLYPEVDVEEGDDDEDRRIKRAVAVEACRAPGGDDGDGSDDARGEGV